MVDGLRIGKPINYEVIPIHTARLKGANIYKGGNMPSLMVIFHPKNKLG